jgi:hypothetical protein
MKTMIGATCGWGGRRMDDDGSIGGRNDPEGWRRSCAVQGIAGSRHALERPASSVRLPAQSAGP